MWRDGRVATEDAVEGAPPLTGAQLEDGYWAAIRKLMFGSVGRRGNSVVLGPIELLRLSEPRVGAHSVEWPIAGGLLTGAPGGRWRVTSDGDRIVASVEGYRPRLPRGLYVITHLQVHLLFTRLFLLRLRGDAAPPGIPASPANRRQAAIVDVALCLTVMRLIGLRPRPKTVLGVLAGYHIACWSISGWTLGGLVMRQRVVAKDGRRLTPAQSALRLAVIPLSWIARRPIHDEIASSGVISDPER